MRTVVAHAERDPAFAKALLREAATLFLNGEPETARLQMAYSPMAGTWQQRAAA